jgi:hypothetical protein
MPHPSELCGTTLSSWRLYKAILDQHCLIGLADISNRLEHTWFKKAFLSQSLSMGMILINIPITSLRTNNLHTIFDNTFLAVILQRWKSNHNPPTKDFIIRSDEFLVRAKDQIQEHVTLTSLMKK